MVRLDGDVADEPQLFLSYRRDDAPDKANRLRVVPQLKYRPAHNLAIDLAFFINGVPVATVEVKTDFTQSAAAAMEQYRIDRQPIDLLTRRKEPLLTFKRGAVVHFALSDSDIQMTTRLDGLGTQRECRRDPAPVHDAAGGDHRHRDGVDDLRYERECSDQ